MIITIGAFDGFHRGHARLLEEARRLAVPAGESWGAVTFHPHPGVFLGFLGATLFTERERELIRRFLGVPHLFILQFDRALQELLPEVFWCGLKETFRRHGMGISGVVTGRDFRFGLDQKGTPKALDTFCRAEGLPAVVLDLLEHGKTRCSSTEARRAVASGDVRRAEEILGYPWFIWSRVVPGNQRGRTLGFPTANLELPGAGRVLPAPGVYAAALPIHGQWHAGALSVGDNPTFGDVHETRAEVFVLDFRGDLYGDDLPVLLLDRLRSLQRFPDGRSLAGQIERDVAQCRDIFQRGLEARPEFFASFASCVEAMSAEGPFVPDVWRLAGAD
ncbi:MAG: riboflavin biosynthesis protein RibF [Fretibacterium sp.]|nr:riboflavin biosynthesis protein RibF [Fretibacterium sp.]